MTAGIEEVALNVDTLSHSVEEVSSSIIEMAASIKQIGFSIQNLMEASTTTASSISEMDSSIRQVETNARDTATISEEVLKDAEMGKQAVDAAIIAAQAGPYGKGFAVVADEIKELSERTSTSTREIARLVEGVQNETQRAVE